MSQKDNILVKKALRKKYLARASSDKKFLQEVYSKIENPDKHPFGPFGDSTASIFLAPTFDTNSLDVEMWSVGFISSQSTSVAQFGPAKAIRQDILHKLSNDYIDEVQSAYEKLNAYAVRCMPMENSTDDDGDEPRAVARDPETGAPLTAHDYRFAGDIPSVLTLGRLRDSILAKVREILGDNVDMIEYINPIKLINRSQNLPLELSIDEEQIKVNLKGETLDA